jgi:hypothetical protein
MLEVFELDWSYTDLAAKEAAKEAKEAKRELKEKKAEEELAEAAAAR